MSDPGSSVKVERTSRWKECHITPVRVPSLNLTIVKSENINKLQVKATRGNRRGSEGDITNESVRNSRIFTQHQETLREIETIKSQLEVIRSCVLLDDLKIGSEIVEIKKQVQNIFKEIENTPRLISRCDATVGNTQMILSRMIEHKKEIIENVSQNITQNISHHDDIIVDILEMILKLNNTVVSRLTRIEKLLNLRKDGMELTACLSEAVEKLAIPPLSPSSDEEPPIGVSLKRSSVMSFGDLVSTSDEDINRFAESIGCSM